METLTNKEPKMNTTLMSRSEMREEAHDAGWSPSDDIEQDDEYDPLGKDVYSHGTIYRVDKVLRGIPRDVFWRKFTDVLRTARSTGTTTDKAACYECLMDYLNQHWEFEKERVEGDDPWEPMDSFYGKFRGSRSDSEE
jgi:hypothetical protein